jgi:hypothetical protein
MAGTSANARRTANPIMWVKDTLPPPVRARWLFRIWRLISSSFAGTVRTDVAVGTARLASMFSTIRADAPRSTEGVSPSSTSAVLPVFSGGRGTGAGAGAGAAGVLCALAIIAGVTTGTEPVVSRGT